MGIIESNRFSYTESTTQNSINSINLEDNYINKENRIIPLEESYTTISDKINTLKDSILHKCKGYEDITFTEIELTLQNFAEHHFNLMNNRCIVLLPSENDGEYRYLTPGGNIYFTSVPKLIRTINEVPVPHKVSLDYIYHPYEQKIFNLKLLSKVLFGIEEDNNCDLIKHYIKPTIEIKDTSITSLSYYILNIFPRLEHLITVNYIWKYVYLENDLDTITRNSNCIDITNEDTFNSKIEDCKEKLSILFTQNNIDLPISSTKEELLKYIALNKDCHNSLNKKSLKFLEYEYLYNIIENIDMLNILTSLQENYKFPTVNTYSNDALIDNGIEIPFNPSDNKILIKGSYTDIYFKILAEILHNNDYIKLCEDNNLIAALLGEKISKNTMFLDYLEKFINATNNGFTSKESILKYFEEKYLTILSQKDYETLELVYNNQLKDLSSEIAEYNDKRYINYNPKAIIHNNKATKLGIAINDKLRSITKSLFNELYLYFYDYNKKNKSKIEVVYMDKENIYVLADPDSFNVAFDTITRIMPKAFNKHCYKVVARCNVEVIKNR